MVVYANGADAAGVATATRCKIYGGTNRLVIAYVAYGSSTYGNRHPDGLLCRKGADRRLNVGGAEFTSIINLRVHDIVAAAAYGGAWSWMAPAQRQ